MSGHSKWASIKHQKAVTDARRGAAFTKLANMITVAAKQGGGDPEMNFKLRLAIQKAKQSNMPTANVERAIKKGTGEGGGAQVEEIMYEGMGPGGVAVMIQVATDNRNRTAAEVRSILTKSGGRMVDNGAVSYQFDQKGVITLKTKDPETAALTAIEAGADDIDDNGDGEITVYTPPTKLDTVRQQLSGYDPGSAELQFIPKSPVEITDPKTAGQIIKMMDKLDELDDVAETYANFDIPEELMEQAA